MEVGKINRSINKVHVAKQQPKVAFGVGQQMIDSTKLRKEISKNMPSAVKKMLNLEWLKGEVGGILITAIGTGLVAPIFIAFNPLSDKDEDTKKYTALRQPVSAILTILIQLGLLKPLGMLYDSLTNSGKLGKSIGFNQEKLHSESYWKHQAKKSGIKGEEAANRVRENRANDINKVATELETNGQISLSDNREVDNKILAQSVNSALDARIEKEELIITSCTDEKIEAKAKRAHVLLTKDSQRNNVVRTLCEKLENAGSLDDAKNIIVKWKSNVAKDDADLNEIADEFLRRNDLNNLKNRATSTIDKINCFETALDNSAILINKSNEIKERLKKLKKLKNSTEGIAKLREIAAQLREIAEGSGDVADKGGLSQMLDVIENTEDKKLRDEYIDKYIKRIDDYVNARKSQEKILKVYQNGFYTDQKDAATARKNLLESLKLNINEKIEDIRGAIKGISDKLEGFTTKEVVEQLRDKIEKKVNGYKQVTSILVGLFVTLPITCTVLNWVYPRFMDIFFPELANSKKSEAPEEKIKNGGKK